MNSSDIAMQLPASFYVIIGTFIVANLSSIFAFFYGGIKMYGKAIEWKTSMEHRVAKNEKDIQNAWNHVKTERG